MSESERKPRLCHLVKWPEFSGYGFNLHAERGKAGQYIGKVDEGSPAVAAGLKESDRIVEVNGVNIGNENHQQVVSRIKAGGEEVTLLVVDAETDSYYKENRILVTSTDEDILKFSAARDEPRPAETESTPLDPEDEPEPEVEEQEPEPEPEVEQDPETVLHDYETVPPYVNPQDEEEQEVAAEVEPEPEPELAPEPEPEPEPEVSVTPAVVSDVVEDTPVKFYPRLCHMAKWPDFVGYGFNLHAERDRTGQFIGTVDDASPAQTAGLKEGDRIIEVNGSNIESDSHQEVIRKVKAGGDETQLLVVDTETDEYYKSRGIRVHNGLEEVRYKKSDRSEVQENKENQVPSMNSDSGVTARLCHIKKWPHFQGYGFNLHAEKNKSHGQFIGKIDDGSPAENAGLKEGDRIVEVNGANVEVESHQAVIGYIKAGGNETRLLVVDSAADQSFKSRGIKISGSMSQLQYIKTEDRGAPVNGQAEVSQPQRQMAPTPAVNSAPPQTNGKPADLSQGLQMSAKEMREMLARKKKADPKHNKMSFQSKLEAFQKM
ncbi:Na(+)/H(+) exchange regulatory cofactor NHE-RF1-like [Ylistrum balloti]|uniref:Na(+)/H(+) exchange regulatory cofactor NHE-RF1-like n=1 Tax=Ylistrum balloti TaxID=509963 RepID=UPI0029058487|nr:Na(+)/H(+) exchange regulatory cofactor NHE-RF1-like [Ylistrum balloti]